MDSIKTRTNIFKLLSNIYGIEQEIDIFPLGKGEWNSIYKIETEHSLVLRISHSRKKQSHLAFELDVMAHIAESFPVVPRIRPTSGGDLYYRQNGVFYALFEFKEGIPINVDLTRVRQAGRLLGRIHKVLLEYSHRRRYIDGFSIIDFDWDNNYFFSGDVLEAAAEIDITSASKPSVLTKIIEKISFLREAREVIERWVNHHQRHNHFTESIIHGDFYKGNILAVENSITAVLDWDETMTSWQEYEVANAVWEFSRDDSRLRINSEWSKAFLEAYTAEKDGLALDEQSLIYLIAFRRLVEIHLNLYGLLHGEPYDLDYAYLNVRYPKRILSRSI